MKQQVSRKAIELRVKWLNEALGRPVEPWTKIEGGCKGNAGNFHLDHQLGGYRIEEMLSTGGANATFGHQRMSKTELCNFLDAILETIRILEPAIQTCREVLVWAATPQDHGGNPYCKVFVKTAEIALNKANGA